VAGKGLAAGLRALTQAAIVYIVALIIGVHVLLDPLRVAGVALAVILGSGAFAMFSLSIAALIKNRDRVMGFGQLMTMPLFFASSAIYPVALMPSWLQAISAVNSADLHGRAIRTFDGHAPGRPLSLRHGLRGAVDLGDRLMLIAARLYPRVAV